MSEGIQKIEVAYPYQEGHPSCPIPGKLWNGALDLHDHRTDQHGSYGTFAKCMMRPRGISCRVTGAGCDDCKLGIRFKKLGLKGADCGK